ncbi:MAG: hypothetical protein FWE21_01995 [Defluviitaleaceae bacterium]|nr:hypothetical protein [Defluviitaleaceae bacterium]
MARQLNLRKALRIFAVALIMVVGLVVLTACDGANSHSFTLSVNENFTSFDGGYSVTADRIDRGHRNRTFNLSASDLGAIHVYSTVGEGSVTLTISQDGTEDGTEVVLNLSNGFDGFVDTSSLNPGRIRFSLRYNSVRDVYTVVTWN